MWIPVCELRGMKNTCIHFEQSDFISDAKPLMFQIGEKKILILMGVSLPHPLGHSQRCVYTVLVCGFRGTCLTCKAQTARSFPCFGLSTDIILCLCILESEQVGPGTSDLYPQRCPHPVIPEMLTWSSRSSTLLSWGSTPDTAPFKLTRYFVFDIRDSAFVL